MTINNVPAYLASLWDWSLFNGCFRGFIRPSDVDGIIERRGQFLFLEGKPGNKEVSNGQLSTFQALQKTGFATIMIIWGDAPTGRITKLRVLYPSGKDWQGPADRQLARLIASVWFTCADHGLKL